jgi:C4-dicarboxylate transporter, DctQ subunit
VNRLTGRIFQVMAGIAALLIIFTVLSISCEVVLRYCFKKPLSWTVEVTEYLQVYMTFFSAAWILRHGGHVRFEILINSVSPRLAGVFFLVASLLGFVSCGLLTIFSAWVTWEQLISHTPVIKTLQIPKWLVLLPIPIGCAFLTLEFLMKMIRREAVGE